MFIIICSIITMNKKVIDLQNEIKKLKRSYEQAPTVGKRKISRIIKALTKEIKQIEYSSSIKASKKQQTDFSKSLLNAGSIYNEEKNKGFTINKQEIIRDRKKYEKGEALGAFKIVVFEDHLYYEQVFKEDIKVLVPNIPVIKQLIENELRKQIMYNNSKNKLSSFISIKYTLLVGDAIEKKSDFVNRYFNSDIQVLNTTHSINSFINNIIASFEKELEQAKNGSDLQLISIDKLYIKTAKSKAIVGGSYIELPDFIKNKKACVNIINDDDKCFYWSLMAFKHYNEMKGGCKNKSSSYKKFNDIKEPDDIKYPLDIDFIPQFEKLNDLKINVFELNDDNSIKILYHSSDKYKDVVNLLWFEKDNSSHYVWIKDINKLDKHNVATHTTMYRCEYCLSQRFLTKENLFKHIKVCQVSHTNCNELLPEEGKNILEFKNIGNKFNHPFHVIADFESTLLSINEEENEDKTKRYQKHIPNSFGLKYNCIHDEYSKPVQIFNSPNPEEVCKKFIEELEKLGKESYELTQQNKTNIILSDDQKQNHKIKMVCEECNCKLSYQKELNGKINPSLKVRHHDHITGNFISTLCYNCNIQFEYKKFLPVYIHNLKGYDAHLFITSLVKYGYQNESSENISCIPNNEERYISFSKKISVGEYTNKKGELKNIMYEIRFLDTFAFMASSIDKLSDNLRNKSDDINELRKSFKYTSEFFKDDEQFKLMIRKGIYPYDYIDDFNKLYTSYLPDINEFYSKLNKSKCSNEDYQQAQLVWRTFNCKTLLDYHNIYLYSDVLLLSDIWSNFSKVCYKDYNLDVSYYFTAPSLSFDAMLKETEIKLELLTDINMYNMIEKTGIRGGISQISHRHAKANNKYMSTYDDTKDDSYIVYLDANNLYGYSMIQHMPTGNFKWNNNIWTKESILDLDDKATTGYLFDVDISYPVELHDKFNQYPPCPENISIKKEYLSEWQQENYNETNITKLCCTLQPKNNYVINYRYLKLALSLGVKLKNVNRVLQYDQSDFMAKYIMKNTNLRMQSKNEFEKDFYKLMNNSVFGKTMENVRNRINFRLITTEKEAMAVKNLKRFTIFNKDLVGLHIQKTEVKLCKPIYLGQNILDDAKALMADFHYNFMLKKIDRKNINLLFTDTDSLCYHIKETDIFEIIKNNKDEFDLSDYPKDHELYDPKNKKVIGKFKNESIKQITEFVGLRSKLYSFTVDGETKCKNRCKGIKQSVVKNEIKTSDYVNTLNTRESKSIEQNNIRSYEHELYSETQKKIALSAKDDKIYVCDDNITCYSIGHYKISK